MHYFVRDWADRRTFSPRLLCRLLTEVRSSDRPIVVHCCSGVGRSGTLIAIEIILEKLIAGEAVVDSERVLQEMRRQRACAISTDAQYLFVHRVVIHYLEAKKRLKNSLKPAVATFIAEYDKFIQSSLKLK
uniref:TYR_PHOSPHATASE_2 domain-containing protein n=1 Tax=Steinernema glaseri TaxID=37863 RepID=A0A1I8AUW3_9BILA